MYQHKEFYRVELFILPPERLNCWAATQYMVFSIITAM
jgi:hypothetical protein